MLQTQAVEPSTLELLKGLQSKSYLTNFHLVGGTALALFYGHRQSIDLDIFTNVEFNEVQLLEQIQQDYSYQLFSTSSNTLKGSIDNINVDIIAHRYPLLEAPIKEKGISLLSDKDIIAMKLNAISISGQRSKDFVDIYFALDKYGISDIIDFYKEKYSQRNSAHIVKSLIYFDDVDTTDWPVLLREKNMDWNFIKERLEQAVTEFMKQDDTE